MAGLKEFKTRIESDAEFAAKFKGAQTDEQLIALAKAEGYDLEQLSDDELDHVAGGCEKCDFFDWLIEKINSLTR